MIDLLDLPNAGNYRTIYCDPPWLFKTYSGEGEGKSASKYYACLSMEVLTEFPVSTIAAKDAVLLLWVTAPMLERAFNLLNAWGFQYKTVGFCWAKTRKGVTGPLIDVQKDIPIGTGYWTRANPEYCLLATRGSPNRVSKSVRELIVSPRREHSRKPDEIYNRIEELLPGPYVELFARSKRPGWDAWGDEVDKFGSVLVA